MRLEDQLNLLDFNTETSEVMDYLKKQSEIIPGLSLDKKHKSRNFPLLKIKNHLGYTIRHDSV